MYNSINTLESQAQAIKSAGFIPPPPTAVREQDGRDWVDNPPQKEPPMIIRADGIEPKPIEWVVENFIPRSMLSSLQGLPDVGKSFLTGAITTAVTRGDGKLPAPDGTMTDCVHGNVLIFNSDDSPSHTTVPRLKKMGADLSKVFFENPDSTPLTFADERLPKLLEQIKPVLVVFDPIQNFIGTGVDFHRVNEIHPVMRNIELLAEKCNCAILCVQHISKSAASGNGGASVSWGLGSMGINGIFRCVWTVGRVNDVDNPFRRAILSAKTNIVPGIPPAYLFDLDPSIGFVWAGVSTEVTAKDLLREQHSGRGRPSDASNKAENVIKELLSQGEMKSADLQNTVIGWGISRATYERARNALKVRSYQKGRIWYSTLSDTQNSLSDTQNSEEIDEFFISKTLE